MREPLLLWLSRIDDKLFLIINERHSHLLDLIMTYISWPWLWIPLYIALLFICVKEFGRHSIYACLAVLTLIGLTLFIDDDIVKTTIKRLPPVCDANLMHIHIMAVVNGCQYAFASAQAACAFAIALFLNSLFDSRYRLLKISLFAWALIISYSRVYTGLHFPGDILGSFILSAALSFIIYRFYYLYYLNYLQHSE